MPAETADMTPCGVSVLCYKGERKCACKKCYDRSVNADSANCHVTGACSLAVSSTIMGSKNLLCYSIIRKLKDCSVDHTNPRVNVSNILVFNGYAQNYAGTIMPIP